MNEFGESDQSDQCCCEATDVDDGQYSERTPSAFALFQNYPNPFNPSTRIEYQLGQRGHVNLTVRNILGQKVRTLVNEWQGRGRRRVIWNGRDEQGEEVSSGVYYYRLKSGALTQIRKMLFLK
jgi:hypothetical protein